MMAKLNLLSGAPFPFPSDSSTPLRWRSSAITEFLTPHCIKESKGKGKASGGACVLTSDDSLTLLQEEKKDEEEVKLNRKLEWEEKQAAKEVENKERERKLTERKKKAQELEEKYKQKGIEMKKEK